MFLKHEFQEKMIMLIWEMLDIRLALDVRLFKCKEMYTNPVTKKESPVIGMKFRADNQRLNRLAGKYQLNMKFDHLKVENETHRELFIYELSEQFCEENVSLYKK